MKRFLYFIKGTIIAAVVLAIVIVVLFFGLAFIAGGLGFTELGYSVQNILYSYSTFIFIGMAVLAVIIGIIKAMHYDSENSSAKAKNSIKHSWTFVRILYFLIFGWWLSILIPVVQIALTLILLPVHIAWIILLAIIPILEPILSVAEIGDLFEIWTSGDLKTLTRFAIDPFDKKIEMQDWTDASKERLWGSMIFAGGLPLFLFIFILAFICYVTIIGIPLGNQLFKVARLSTCCSRYTITNTITGKIREGNWIDRSFISGVASYDVEYSVVQTGEYRGSTTVNEYKTSYAPREIEDIWKRA